MTLPLSARPRSRARLLAAMWGAVLLAVLVAAAAVRETKPGTDDFGHFYRAAQGMTNGQDIYAAARGRYIYPPLLAFVFQPLAFLPEKVAAMVWLGASALAAAAALLIASQEAARRWLRLDCDTAVYLPVGIAAVTALLNADKLNKVFGLGQSDALVLLGSAAVLRWMDRRPLAAGAVVGAVANIKYVSAIFVPYFLWKRNYRAAFASAVSFVFFLLLPSVQVGFARGIDYIGTAFGGLGGMIGLAAGGQRADISDVTWYRSVSITSALFRLTRSQGWPDAFAIALVLLAGAAVMASFIAIGRRAGISVFCRQRDPSGTASDRAAHLEWALLTFLAVAFSPQTTSRHMVLLAPVYALIVAVFSAQEKRSAKVALAGAITLAVASLSLPPGRMGFQTELNFWRAIGGATWCALILMLVLIRAAGNVVAPSPIRVPKHH